MQMKQLGRSITLSPKRLKSDRKILEQRNVHVVGRLSHSQISGVIPQGNSVIIPGVRTVIDTTGNMVNKTHGGDSMERINLPGDKVIAEKMLTRIKESLAVLLKQELQEVMDQVVLRFSVEDEEERMQLALTKLEEITSLITQVILYLLPAVHADYCLTNLCSECEDQSCGRKAFFHRMIEKTLQREVI